MRKGLICILLLLIVGIMGMVMYRGMSIGPLKIYSFQELSDRSADLNNAIKNASSVENKYEGSLTQLNEDIAVLASAKKAYLDLVTVSTDSEIQQSTQTKTYTIEYLWSRVGNHATAEGVNIKMDVEGSTMSDTSYRNLNFTVKGTYLAMTNFMYAIENDTSLDFTIDNFDMQTNQCTFKVSDIKIQVEKTTENVSNTTDSTEENNTTSNNVSNNETTNTSKTENAIANAVAENSANNTVQ